MDQGPSFLTDRTTEDVVIRTTFDPRIQQGRRGRAGVGLRKQGARRLRGTGRDRGHVRRRRRARHGRRAESSRRGRPVQPRDPGQPADGVCLQALRLRRRTRPRVFALRLGGGRADHHRRAGVGAVEPEKLHQRLQGPGDPDRRARPVTQHPRRAGLRIRRPGRGARHRLGLRHRQRPRRRARTGARRVRNRPSWK